MDKFVGEDMSKNVIIIGGGPAGVSASLYTVRAGIDTTLIVHGDSALDKAENIENYYGFPGGISGAELKARGLEQARGLGVRIVCEEVVGLGFEDKLVVKTAGVGSDEQETDSADGSESNRKTYPADAIIIAMGSQRKAPDIPGIKEFEGRGVSYCAVCDGFFYRGKTVAVLGSGEYADSEAAELAPLAETVIRLDDVDAIERFSGEGDADGKLRRVEFKDGTSQEIDGLFIAFGTAGPGDLAKKIGIMTEGSRLIVNEEMATNVPGIFAAGDCTGGLLQVSKAVADGAKAATSAIKFLRG